MSEMTSEIVRVSEEGLLLTRTFSADLAVGDGRTLDGRLVPYGVPSVVQDLLGPSQRVGPVYREEFVPGAFARQVQAPDRLKVWLNFEHEQGLRGIVGHGVELREEPDALYGSFRMHANADGDKALTLVSEGLLSGLSIEFAAKQSRTAPGGVVQRLRAHLDKVALCRSPAYVGAGVLAVREAPEVEVPELAPPNFQRLEALGIMPLFTRAVVTRPWDGNAARFTDEQYQRSCLIDRGGDAPVKERCSVPVLEPSGDLNVNALGPAAGALRGARTPLVDVTQEQKRAAARKLIRYYRLANQEPPPGIVALAG